MIHIDELFRQQMEDREASPKPGAWSNMRGLLDKEMPVAASGANWRRVFGYFTGLLLLASASMGGYSLYSSQLEENQGTAPFALRAANTGFAPGGAQADAQASPPAGIPIPVGTAGQTSGVASLPAGTARGSGRNESGLGASSNTASRQDAAQHSETAVATRNPAATAVSGSVSAASTPAIVNGDRLARAERRNGGTGSIGKTGASRKATTASPGNVPQPIPQAVAGGTGQAAGQSPILPANAGPDMLLASAMPAGTKSAATSPLLSQSAVPKRASTNDALSAGTAASGNKPLQEAPLIRRLDTIQRIEIVTRYRSMPGGRRAVMSLDTLPLEAIVIERLWAEPQPQIAAVQTSSKSGRRSPARATHPKPEPILASAAKPAAAEAAHPAVASVPASAPDKDPATTASEIAGKLSGNRMNFWQSLRLDERVEKAKLGLQSIQLYPGIIAGINASPLTPNALGGFQLGVTSLIAINEWWSVLGELKYMHRFNTGSSVRDDYMKVSDVTMTPVTLFDKDYINYQWKEARVSHYFNYETIQTIELPVALRYNNNRFFTQGGVNFVSNRAIAAREVTNVSTEVRSTSTSIPATSKQSPLPNSEPRVMMADFGNRFGIGYLLGAGYSFTPSVYVDFRMTHTFWDNSASTGARQISKDLLRTPSFQLSVGYRFGVARERP